MTENLTQSYQNVPFGFVIHFPNNWFTEENIMGQIVSILSPTRLGDIHPNLGIMAQQLDEEMSVEEYASLNLKGIRQMLNEVTVQEEGDLQISGQAAKYIVMSFRQGLHNFEAIQFQLVKNKMGYTLTGLTPAGSLENYRQDFLSIAQSIQFLS